MRKLRAAFAARAIAMLGHRKAECERSKVGDLAEEFDRGFRFSLFQFAISGAHATE